MSSQRVLVYGAGGHTGQAIVTRAKQRGLDIVVAGRPSVALAQLAQAASCEMRTAPVDDAQALSGILQDIGVVIQTLGVDFSPRLIFEGTRLFSESTRILVDAMKAAGVKRLITVTGLGAGDSRGHGGLLYDAVVFPLLLKRVYDDKDVQEWIVRSSRLDWTLCGQAF